MASAPSSSTTPRTPCTICCQLSQTSVEVCGFEVCGFSGSAMGYVELGIPFVQILFFQSFACQARNRFEMDSVIFPRPARLCHGTEDDVRAIGDLGTWPRRVEAFNHRGTRGITGETQLRSFDAQTLRHFFVEEA